MTDKCCGTCRHWSPPTKPKGRFKWEIKGRCDWPQQPVPFWAQIATGEHEDYTNDYDGGVCPTWQEQK